MKRVHSDPTLPYQLVDETTFAEGSAVKPRLAVCRAGRHWRVSADSADHAVSDSRAGPVLKKLAKVSPDVVEQSLVRADPEAMGSDQNAGTQNQVQSLPADRYYVRGFDCTV